VHWLKAYNIPEGSRTARGKAIVNFLELEKGEKVTAVVPARQFDDSHYLVMATQRGIIKKTNLMSFSRPRKGGIIAVVLDPGDRLINAELTDGQRDILIATKNGNAVRFNEMAVRPLGRNTRGVKGIKLRDDDEVIGMVILAGKKSIFTVTEHGYGKRTGEKEYSRTNRGGIGVINIKTSERNGKVVAVHSVYENNDLMLISRNGIMIRTAAKNISQIGRNTQGVRIMKLGSDDRVVSAAKIVNEEVSEVTKQEKEIIKEVEEHRKDLKSDEELVAQQISDSPAKEETE